MAALTIFSLGSTVLMLAVLSLLTFRGQLGILGAPLNVVIFSVILILEARNFEYLYKRLNRREMRDKMFVLKVKGGKL